MIKQDLKIAWRQLGRKRLLSFLKIGGLSIGIAASILLLKYIDWQWNFDRFHKNSAKIVRVQHNYIQDNQLTQSSAMTYAGVAVAAKTHFPQVKDYVRLGRWIANDVVFRHGENVIRESDFFFTDPSFFDVFSFELLEGDPATALAEPNTIVFTESRAKTLFGTANPIGKEVIFESRRPFKVTGIVKDPPLQSHIQFSALSSLSTMKNWGLDVYGDEHLENAYVYAYLLLASEADQNYMANKLTEKVSELKPHKFGGSDEFKLQPFESIHLYSNLQHEISTTGQGNGIRILFGISILILLLGWINHFNIFSAQAMDQSTSISVKRIIGASRIHLFSQVAVEAFIYNFLGLLAGILLATLASPFMTRVFSVPFMGFGFLKTDWSSPVFHLMLIIGLGTIVSAAIPALGIAFSTMGGLLKKDLQLSYTHLNFRRTLVIFQFATIIALIGSAGIMYRQTRFMEKKDIGITLDDVVAVRAPLGTTHHKDLHPHYQRFKQFITTLPAVEGIGISRNIPGNALEVIDNVTIGSNSYAFSFLRNVIDPDFLSIYQHQMLAKDVAFHNSVAGQNNQVVINKKALDLLGFPTPEAALKQKLTIWNSELEIVGVVNNHHQQSLHHPTAPIIYDLFDTNYATEDGYYSIKLHEGTLPATILPDIEAAYTKAFPMTVFDPISLKAHFNEQYRWDRSFYHLNLGFTFIAILIACFGLIGLFMIILEKRLKEISIRKVLGATLINIFQMLAKDLVRMILIASLVAIPVSYYFMNNWLQNYSYRIEPGWMTFAMATIIAIMIALFTVSIQIGQAARSNPVESLRND